MKDKTNQGSGLITGMVLFAGFIGLFGALKYRQTVEATQINPVPISRTFSVVEDVYDSVIESFENVVEKNARPQGYEILG
ncbi:MAG: hypothetical protein KKF50_04920 [Nanoarchaeota archaeon]|nr:hypothetical protein [Nanoarchaeota archaeon]